METKLELVSSASNQEVALPLFFRGLSSEVSRRIGYENMAKNEKTIEVFLPESLVKKVDEYVEKWKLVTSRQEAIEKLLQSSLEIAELCLKQEGKFSSFCIYGENECNISISPDLANLLGWEDNDDLEYSKTVIDGEEGLLIRKKKK